MWTSPVSYGIVSAMVLGAESALPQLVRDYVQRALGDVTGPVPGGLRITQVGQMWQRPGARPLRFTAVEEFAVEDVAFSWRAGFRMLPFVMVRVVDRYGAGEGTLEARVWGFLPVMRRRGPDLAVGEAMRYLAELPWVPHAMIANRQLEWRQIDETTAEVATRVGRTRAAVRLTFDGNGDIVESFSDARPRPESNNQPTPWGGVFRDYAVLDGIRLPTRADVRWELPEGPFVYWSGEVTRLRLGAYRDGTASSRPR